MSLPCIWMFQYRWSWWWCLLVCDCMNFLGENNEHHIILFTPLNWYCFNTKKSNMAACFMWILYMDLYEQLPGSISAQAQTSKCPVVGQNEKKKLWRHCSQPELTSPFTPPSLTTASHWDKPNLHPHNLYGFCLVGRVHAPPLFSFGFLPASICLLEHSNCFVLSTLLACDVAFWGGGGCRTGETCTWAKSIVHSEGALQSVMVHVIADVFKRHGGFFLNQVISSVLFFSFLIAFTNCAGQWVLFI